MPMRPRSLVLTGAALASLALGPVAFAQQAANSQESVTGLEEIVVTARKEAERLVDVPLAITAFSQKDIEEKAIRSLNDVAQLTPGLTFSNVQGEFLPTPVIRGFAPIEVRRASNNAAIFIDGVYVSGREGLNFNQLDLERVEVIKGPQAALYGRDSFSGAINYVTARPTSEGQVKTELTFGNDNKALAMVSLSGPLFGDTLKGRIAFQSDQFDGTYHNQYASNPYAGPGPVRNIGGHKFETGQGGLWWNPTDKFEASLSAYLSHDKIDNSAISAVAANCEDLNKNIPATQGPNPVNFGNYCGTFQPVGANGLSVIPQAWGENRALQRDNLHLTWDTGVGTLTSLSSYSDLQHTYLLDGSRDSVNGVSFAYLQNPLTNNSIFGFPAPQGTFGVFQAGLLQVGTLEETKEFSEEIRFSSPKDQPLRWSAGLYYYDTKDTDGIDGVIGVTPLPANNGTLCLACLDANTFGTPTLGQQAFDAAGGDPGIWTPWFTNPGAQTNFNTVFTNKTSAPSVFGTLDYDFNSQWKGGLEARYTREKVSYVDGSVPNTGGSINNGSKTFGLVNWRATLDYKPSKDWTIYGALANAEKSGGFSDVNAAFSSGSVGIPGAYDKEKNIGGELGVKAELLDRRVYFDVDVYYYKWKNIAVPQVFPSYLNPATGQVEALSQPIDIDENVGDAKLQGIEFQVDGKITDHFNATLSGSFLDAKFTNAVVGSFVQFPTYYPNGNITGNTLQRTSKVQGALSLGYQAPLVNDVDWYLRGDLSYRGKQFADNTNEAILPALTFLNAHLGVQGKHWTFELWGRNLTNEDKPTDAYRDVYFSNALPGGVHYSGPQGTDVTGNSGSGTIFPWRYSVSYPELRTFGVTLRLKF